MITKQFECTKTFFLTYSCKAQSSIKEIDEPEKVPPRMTYSELADGSRLTKQMGGYSLRVQATAIIHKFSYCGFFIILGFFFIITLLIKDLLGFFIADSAMVAKQRHADLLIDQHLKED